MMLGFGEAAASDDRPWSDVHSVGDEAPRLPSFDWSRGDNAISAHQLVELLRQKFFNVLLVDVSGDGSGALSTVRQMEAPAPGTVSAQQPQSPNSWLASTMDRFKEYPPIVGSRRFTTLSKTRDAIRFVPAYRPSEVEHHDSDMQSADALDAKGDATAVDAAEASETADSKSPASSRKKKRDSGVDLRDQSESGSDYSSDDSDSESDEFESVGIRAASEELEEDMRSPRQSFRSSSFQDMRDPSQLIVHPDDLEELERAVYHASSTIGDPHWQRRLHGITIIIDEYGTAGGFAHRLSESLAREIADEFDPSVGSLLDRDGSHEEITCPRCSEEQQNATECIYGSEEICRGKSAQASGDLSMPPPPPSAFRSAVSFSVAHFTTGQPVTLYLAGGLRSFRRLYPQLCLDHPCPRMEAIKSHQDHLVDAVWYGRLPGGHSNDHPVEIVPHLYLGSAHAALPEHLDGYKVGLVIRLGAFSPLSKKDGVEYIDVEIDDAVGVHIATFFESVCGIIAARISRGINVLVHCHAGVSRSATIVLAYLLMQSSGRYGSGPACSCHPANEGPVFKSLRSAFHYVFVRRPIVRPNEGFCKQLQSLEMALFGTEESSMPRWWMYASYLYGTDWIEHALRDEEVMQAESTFMDGYESASDGTSVDMDHVARVNKGTSTGAITLRRLEDAIMTDIAHGMER